MARVPDLRRITVEEYSEEQRGLIEKLGTIINQFMEQTIDALNGKLNNLNMNRAIKSFQVSTVSGIPNGETLIKPDVNGTVAGLYIINTINLTDTTNLTNSPFITWTQQNGLIKVKHITGLSDNKKYNVTVEIIGS